MSKSRVSTAVGARTLAFVCASFIAIAFPSAGLATGAVGRSVNGNAAAIDVEANRFMREHTPTATSPGSVRANAMPATKAAPPSAMTKRTPRSEIGVLGWTQLPGAAQNIAASPDGSIYVVSNRFASSAGNGIWHYARGRWSSVSGVATRLTVGPDGMLWALDGLGGIHSLRNGVWTTIAGGASDISAASDGSLYVISDRPGNVYGSAIYHYVNGTWTQLPGSGLRIAASWDTRTSAGSIRPGGFYLTNAVGGLYYYSPSAGYTQVRGSASEIAPTVSGGLFVMGAPASTTNGDPIYYYDVTGNSWTKQPGTAVSIATNSTSAYAVGVLGGIYASAIRSTLPMGSGAPLTGPLVAPGHGWGPTAVANALSFPVQSGFNGSGFTIAIVAPGNVYAADLQRYFSFFETPATSRTIAAELLDGASGTPNADGSVESSLDSETVASLAPGANVILYVVPDLSLQSEVDAYNAILSDGLAQVVTSSFGGCESSEAVGALTSIFQAGAQAGFTFVASSGDQGNACFYGIDSYGNPLYTAGVNYPASDPNVIGVGGTETLPPDPLNNALVWNDHFTSDGSQEASGGGVSTLLDIPSFQYGLAGTQSQVLRNVPDIAMPAVDDGIVFAGSWEGVNGTSWGSPEFAAMLAEVYQYCGTAFTNATEIPYLVNGRAAAATAFIDITKGNNRFTSVSATAYTAGVGYDNATGLGVPLGLPFAQTFCPNGSPVYGASLRRARAQSTLRPRVARSYLVNATPNVSRTSMQGRKAQSEPVRIALVLRSSASIASDERSAIGVLRGAGFSIQRTFANHLVIDAIAPSAKVEQLFATEMHNVGQGQFGIRYFPATPVTIPASLAPYIAGVSLDNVINMATPRHRRIAEGR